MTVWIDACALDVLLDGATAVVRFNDVRVALFRSGSEVHALDDTCPHMSASLSEGTVAGGRVTCRDHGWTYALADGRRTDRVGSPVRSHKVRIVDGRIQLADPGPL